MCHQWMNKVSLCFFLFYLIHSFSSWICFFAHECHFLLSTLFFSHLIFISYLFISLFCSFLYPRHLYFLYFSPQLVSFLILLLFSALFSFHSPLFSSQPVLWYFSYLSYLFCHFNWTVILSRVLSDNISLKKYSFILFQSLFSLYFIMFSLF